jgi:hypothetical protein
MPDPPPGPTTDDRCFSRRSLARYWRVSLRAIDDLVLRKILRGFRIGRAMRFSPDDVAEAEERLAAPAGRSRRRRAPTNIDPRVSALLGLGNDDT